MEITSASTMPEVVARWADWLHTYAGTLHANEGPWGEGIKKAAPREVGLDGNQALFDQLQTWNHQGNHKWAGAGPHWNSIPIRRGRVATDPGNNAVIIFIATRDGIYL